MIVQWILDSWKELDEEIIVKLFKARALNLNVDGSKDKSIYYLIKDLPCQEGYNQLQTHLRILDDQYQMSTRFEIFRYETQIWEAAEPLHELLDI